MTGDIRKAYVLAWLAVVDGKLQFVDVRTASESPEEITHDLHGTLPLTLVTGRGADYEEARDDALEELRHRAKYNQPLKLLAERFGVFDVR